MTVRKSKPICLATPAAGGCGCIWPKKRGQPFRITQSQLREVDKYIAFGGRFGESVFCAAYPNLTVKKIPKAVLNRCEWGHDDYSLQVENLPKAPPRPGQQSLFAEEVVK